MLVKLTMFLVMVAVVLSVVITPAPQGYYENGGSGIVPVKRFKG